MVINASQKNLIRMASFLSFYISLILMSIKIWAWLEMRSIALLTIAVDGLIDLMASIVTLVGICYSQRPADKEHRYGHGKAEAIATLVQAFLLIGSGIMLSVESTERLVDSQTLPSQTLGVYIIVSSILCTSILVIIQTVIVNYIPSTAISADRMHYITDIAVNIAVLCALMLESFFGWMQIDTISALIISCFMFWNAYIIIRFPLLQLLDRELSSFDRKKIMVAVLNCSGIEGVHDLRTRNGGDRVFIELHVEVAGHLTIDAGHNICDNAEEAIRALFDIAEVSVHLEATGIIDKRLDDLIK